MALMKPRREVDPRGAELGLLLRECRERAGLTRSELAERLEIAVETVSACEAGRPPRRSTLLRYLHRLPGLSAETLLGVEARRVPEASSSAWASEVSVQGFLAECVEAGPEGVRVTGLRTTEADPTDATVRRGLRRAACSAPGPKLRAVQDDTTEQDFEDGRHEWVDAPTGLEHRCPGPVEGAFLLEIPTRRLVLRTAAEGRRRLCVRNPVTGDEEITDALYPGGREAVDGALEILEPLPRLTYELVEVDQNADEPREPEDLGAAVHAVRHAAGMSVRAVAAKANIGHASIARVEHGADATWETLRSLLTALPELRPQDLLPGPAARDDWSRAQAWEYFARLHGLKATSATKVVEIDSDGVGIQTIETAGLRPIDGALTEATLRVPVLRNVLSSAAPAEVAEILADSEELRARIQRQESDGKRQGLTVRWPSDLKNGGLWLRRKLTSTAPMAMTLDAAQARHGTGVAAYWNGAAISQPYPVERLRLEVVFPHGYLPQDPRAGAWAPSSLPDPARPPLSEAQRPRLIQVVDDDGRVRLILTVTHPAFGLRYGIGWLLS